MDQIIGARDREDWPMRAKTTSLQHEDLTITEYEGDQLLNLKSFLKHQLVQTKREFSRCSTIETVKDETNHEI